MSSGRLSFGLVFPLLGKASCVQDTTAVLQNNITTIFSCAHSHLSKITMSHRWALVIFLFSGMMSFSTNTNRGGDSSASGVDAAVCTQQKGPDPWPLPNKHSLYIVSRRLAVAHRCSGDHWATSPSSRTRRTRNPSPGFHALVRRSVPQFPPAYALTPMEHCRPLPISMRSGGGLEVKDRGQLEKARMVAALKLWRGAGEHPRCLCGGRRMLQACGSTPGCKQFVSSCYKVISRYQLCMCERGHEWRTQNMREDVVTRGCQTVRSALHRSAQHAVRPARSHRRKHRINFIIVTIPPRRKVSNSSPFPQAAHNLTPERHQ